MIRRSLKTKIIIPTVSIFAMLVLVMTVFSSIKFTNYMDTLLGEKITIIANGLNTYLKTCEISSRAAAVSVSGRADVVNAVKERNTQEMIRILTPTLELYNIDYYTVTDENGNVLARTHRHDRFSDSVLNQQNILDALSGKTSTYYEEGTTVKVSVRTGSPIYDPEGVLIGAISAGVRLDTNDAIDELKKRFDADLTVYFGDRRVATTLFQNGQRLIGTQLDPKIKKIVVEDKQEHGDTVDILGKKYNTYYKPLKNSRDEVFAILCAGHSNTEIIAAENSLIINGILIGLAGLVISVVILLMIITKITSPIQQLKHLALDVIHGNFDVEIDKTCLPNDEIGSMMLDMGTLFEVIKSLARDLSQLTRELNTTGKIDFRIDTSKYNGKHRELAEGIQDLADSVLDMNQVVTVMDNLDSMIIVVDFDYNIVYTNRSLENKFGLDLKQCKGKKCYQLIRNFDKPCGMCLMPELLPVKDKFPSKDYEFLYDEINDIWLCGRASIIRWVDGSLVYFQSLNDDSDKKKDQEKLSEAVKIAEMASKTKSAFLANMSHELRTPLNVIISLTELLLEEDRYSHEIRENLHMINNAGHTLLSIVNDILDITKIESGKLTITPVEYHTASLLNDTAILMTTRIGEKPIVFELNISSDLPYLLYGDDLRVKQILNNLLSNAIKYTYEGTVELSVHCEREGNHDVWMNIIVKDTGIGIRPEDLQKLFTDYNQVDVQANRKIEGTGLGLAITKKLVESMDGTITVESEYGKGSTFRVRIRQGFVNDASVGPMIVENLRQFRYAETKRYVAGMLERADLSYARVLVVDDLQANLDVAAGLMRKYLLQVDCVTNGQAAVDRIKLGQPVYNAVFMDHMMPGMDGVEAADKIRAFDTDYAKKIPIIALTANAVTGTEELFYAHDFQAFITKPIDIMRLDSVLQEWVKDKSKNQVVKKRQEDGNAAIEIPGVNADKGLAICGGDSEIYRTVLRSYVADTRAVLEKLHDVTAENLPAYTIAVHGIKGSSANIGAEAIRQTAGKLEVMARNGDLAGILDKNDNFLKETKSLVADIMDWFKKQADPTIKPQLPEPDRDTLERLRQCCMEFDYDTADRLMKELENANYDNDTELVTWLREKIDMFDLDEIVERLADLVLVS